MNTKSILALIAVCGGSSAIADVVVVSSPLQKSSFPRTLPGVALEVDATNLAALRVADEAIIPDFVFADGSTGAVMMAKSRTLTPNARVIVMTPEGERPLDVSGMTLVTGYRVDDPTVRVVLSFSEAGINGVIMDISGKTQIISAGSLGSQSPVIFDPTTLPEGTINWRSMQCGTDELPLPPGAGHHGDHPSGGITDRDAPCKAAVMALETDWEYTRDVFGGNTTAAAQYAITLITADSEIYYRELGVRLTVGYVRVWASDIDPYSTTDTIDRLFEFQDYWNANETGVVRNAAHILSGVRGSYGGVAYMPGLCQDQYDYGLSTYFNGYFPYPIVSNNWQNWDLNVTAHEIGHNFGAPHTHDTSPPIDRCGLGDCTLASQGTIMSYCHTCAGGESNIAMTFHQRIINEYMLPYLNNDAPCSLDRSGITVTADPKSVHAGNGATVRFSIAATTGPGPLTYKWYHGQTEVVNGGRFSGADSNSLQIAGIQPADYGTYTVTTSNDCGSESRSARLLCPADFNSDGAIDFFDYDDFVTCFEGIGCPAGTGPDFNGDGAVDFFDYDDFVGVFEAGC